MTETSERWHSRIRRGPDGTPEIVRMRAGDILQHPYNPKDHPPAQLEGIQASLDAIGKVDLLRAYYSERNGGALTFLDGHGRGEADPDETWDVVVLDITDAEADLFLPVGTHLERLAHLNAPKLDALLRGIEVSDPRLQAMLDEVHAQAGAVVANAFSGVAPHLSDDVVAEVDDDGDELPREGSDGSLLARTEVTIADPRTVVERGQVWRLGPHRLACVDVFTEWELWQPLLRPGCLFVPYPGPFVAVSLKAEKWALVMVQPDPYVAGHIIDRWVDIYGDAHVAIES